MSAGGMALLRVTVKKAGASAFVFCLPEAPWESRPMAVWLLAGGLSKKIWLPVEGSQADGL